MFQTLSLLILTKHLEDKLLAAKPVFDVSVNDVAVGVIAPLSVVDIPDDTSNSNIIRGRIHTMIEMFYSHCSRTICKC